MYFILCPCFIRSERFSYLWIQKVFVFVSLVQYSHPKGFRIFWIQIISTIHLTHYTTTNTQQSSHVHRAQTTLIAMSFFHRSTSIPLDTKAKRNLRTSMINAIIGKVIDRLKRNHKMKELVKITQYRESYRITNVGMADFASCHNTKRRFYPTSSRRISISHQSNDILIIIQLQKSTSTDQY